MNVAGASADLTSNMTKSKRVDRFHPLRCCLKRQKDIYINVLVSGRAGLALIAINACDGNVCAGRARLLHHSR